MRRAGIDQMAGAGILSMARRCPGKSSGTAAVNNGKSSRTRCVRSDLMHAQPMASPEAMLDAAINGMEIARKPARLSKARTLTSRTKSSAR
jgi:hypothetical protein